MTSQAPQSPGRLREVALLFLKLGCIGFGGPAAHVALMRREVVQQRAWVSEEQFLDLLGASNIIPGPSSTELAIYLGTQRAGWRGLVLAGLLFILPAFFIVLALAWLYDRSGSTPAGTDVLYGVKPVVIAVVLQAVYSLGRVASKSRLSLVGAAVAFAIYLAGVNPLFVLFGVALVLTAFKAGPLLLRRNLGFSIASLWPVAALGASLSSKAPDFSQTTLFLTFLKIGAIVYGSGYVLLAYLQDDFVERLHWLTDKQLIDAIAIGQLTPGPVFTTATFVGYLTGSWTGAVLATVAIFLPSFLFVALVYPLVPRLRRQPVTAAFLDGVNAAAIGLMAGVTWQLADAALVDAVTVVVALVSLLVLVRWNPNSAFLVGAGAVVGGAHYLVGL